MRINCGLDTHYKTCRNCDFEIYSEYLFCKHKKREHNLKQTFQNLVLVYKCDNKSHLEILEPMEKPIDTVKCAECDFKLCKEGKYEMHNVEYHEQLYTHQG